MRGPIVEQRVRADLAKAARSHEALDMRNETSSNAAPAKTRIDPDAFEKRDGLRLAAIGVFPDGDFREADGLAVAPSQQSAQ